MHTVLTKDWRELSEAASQERDPKKLMELIHQLNQALDEWERKTHTFPLAPEPKS